MAPDTKTLSMLCLGLIVPSLIYSLVAQLWNLPLKNGRSFFLGVEVGEGFYGASDSRWLARYRAMLVTVHTAIFGILAAILGLGKWDWVPAWAGGTAVFLTGSMMAFTLWARHELGSNPPVLPAALSLEPRRLRDYIQWPIEVLCLMVVGFSWWMMLEGGGPMGLQKPLVMTWTILGLLPGKITIVRQGWPLPADRAAEHLGEQEAARRYSVRVLDALGGLLTSIFLMDAIRHAWPAVRTIAAVQWLMVGIPLALGVVLMVVVVQQKRVFALGRTLRPAGSWAPPSGRATLFSRSGMTWFTVWFGGMMVLTLLLRG